MAAEPNLDSELTLFSHAERAGQGGSVNPSEGPFGRRSHYVAERVRTGTWRNGSITAEKAGLTRDLPVFLAARKTNPIVHAWHGDRNTYCPPVYWDLAIGSGSCGLGCRGCYLIGTFREMRDPYQPLVYDNTAFLWEAVRKWLVSRDRRPWHSLGLGTDRSDSLLFEHITGHARHLIPMFADPKRNPHGAKLLLLTKSKNTGYLDGLPTRNVLVTFSLNPEPVADLWEGKWPDTLERITPPITERLEASLEAQRMGYEVRWRIDPILTPEGWRSMYEGFLTQAAHAGHLPRVITLGTFRQSTPQLDHWRRYWALPEMEWRPTSLRRDGTHYHSPYQYRVRIYRAVGAMCGRSFPNAALSVCKETKFVRKAAGLCGAMCNCLGGKRNTVCDTTSGDDSILGSSRPRGGTDDRKSYERFGQRGESG